MNSGIFFSLHPYYNTDYYFPENIDYQFNLSDVFIHNSLLSDWMNAKIDYSNNF